MFGVVYSQYIWIPLTFFWRSNTRLGPIRETRHHYFNVSFCGHFCNIWFQMSLWLKLFDLLNTFQFLFKCCRLHKVVFSYDSLSLIQGCKCVDYLIFNTFLNIFELHHRFFFFKPFTFVFGSKKKVVIRRQILFFAATL